MPFRFFSTLLAFLFTASASLIADAATVTEADRKGWVIVTSETCNLRGAPEKGDNLVQTVKRFTPLKIEGESKAGYKKVKTVDGKTAWAHESVIGKSCYASINTNDKVNCRKGAGSEYELAWELTAVKNYPLLVIDRKGDYIHVRDYQGDNFWIHQNFLSTNRTCVVKIKSANVRMGPGADNEIECHAEQGVTFQILQNKDDWFEVKHSDGSRGWIAQGIVWGN